MHRAFLNILTLCIQGGLAHDIFVIIQLRNSATMGNECVLYSLMYPRESGYCMILNISFLQLLLMRRLQYCIKLFTYFSMEVNKFSFLLFSYMSIKGFKYLCLLAFLFKLHKLRANKVTSVCTKISLTFVLTLGHYS